MIKINKKTYYIIWVSLLIIILFVFGLLDLLASHYNSLWNKEFAKWNYENAIINHNKSLKYKDNDITNYNLAWDYYKLWQYEKSKEIYEKLLKNKDLNQDTSYNLWNTLYKLWDKEKNTENKIKLWEESLKNYKNILDKKTDKKTQENYDFVKKKLDELKKQQNQDNKDQKNSENNKKEENKDWNSQQQSQENKSWEDSKDWKDWQQTKDSKDAKNTSGNQSWWQKETEKQAESWLSEDEKKSFEQYNEQLKQEQLNNSDSYWKQSQSLENNDIFDRIFQDPFFNNSDWFNDSILNQNEKDW